MIGRCSENHKLKDHAKFMKAHQKEQAMIGRCSKNRKLKDRTQFAKAPPKAQRSVSGVSISGAAGRNFAKQSFRVSRIAFKIKR